MFGAPQGSNHENKCFIQVPSAEDSQRHVKLSFKTILQTTNAPKEYVFSSKMFPLSVLQTPEECLQSRSDFFLSASQRLHTVTAFCPLSSIHFQFPSPLPLLWSLSLLLPLIPNF